MVDDATPDMKAQYENFQNIVRNIHNNQQVRISIYHSFMMRTVRTQCSSFELLKNDGGKAYDTRA